MERLGQRGADGKLVCKFGALIHDDRCSNIFEALVGTLKAAKISSSCELLPSNFSQLLLCRLRPACCPLQPTINLDEAGRGAGGEGWGGMRQAQRHEDEESGGGGGTRKDGKRREQELK
eukprot:766283-Hanusia_phi.AAC.1